jgi:Rrf2 family nitric oxide-sensitive transcriptional repressor
MRLTLHTDYALRLLMLLTIEPDGLHTVEAVSRRYRISRHHLVKVAQTLTRAGLIDSQRGRSGGLRLARPAETIRIGAVVRATEDSLALVECFDAARNTCIVAPACGLRAPLEQALNAFLAVLDTYSLADLVRHPRSLSHMRTLLAAPMTEARP